MEIKMQFVHITTQNAFIFLHNVHVCADLCAIGACFVGFAVYFRFCVGFCSYISIRQRRSCIVCCHMVCYWIVLSWTTSFSLNWEVELWKCVQSYYTHILGRRKITDIVIYALLDGGFVCILLVFGNEFVKICLFVCVFLRAQLPINSYEQSFTKRKGHTGSEPLWTGLGFFKCTKGYGISEFIIYRR